MFKAIYYAVYFLQIFVRQPLFMVVFNIFYSDFNIVKL